MGDVSRLDDYRKGDFAHCGDNDIISWLSQYLSGESPDGVPEGLLLITRPARNEGLIARTRLAMRIAVLSLCFLGGYLLGIAVR